MKFIFLKKISRVTSSIHIDITDNAGGVKTERIDKTFTLGFSNKKSDYSGDGLYIARQLIEKIFHGKIHAENTKFGAVFKIELPYLK